MNSKSNQAFMIPSSSTIVSALLSSSSYQWLAFKVSMKSLTDYVRLMYLTFIAAPVNRKVYNREHPTFLRPYLKELEDFAKHNHFNVVFPILRCVLHESTQQYFKRLTINYCTGCSLLDWSFQRMRWLNSTSSKVSMRVQVRFGHIVHSHSLTIEV